MDTSEIFIKQCEKATEIQELFIQKFKQENEEPYPNLTRGYWFSPKYNLDIGERGKWIKTDLQDREVVRGQCYCVGDFRGWGSEYWCDGQASLEDPELIIWLPCQDQLQEMCKPYLENKYGRYAETFEDLFLRFSQFWAGEESEGFYNGEIKDYGSKFNSMEQLWLAFVMENKYGKVWNDMDWVKIQI